MSLIHNPHPGFDPLIRKIEADGGNLLGVAYAYSFASVIPTWAGPFRRLFEYLELAYRIRKQARKRNILVREFSTYYIFITIPFIFDIRRNCLLLVAHNVQRAENSQIQRALLKIIAILGFRYACLETDAGLRTLLGISDSLLFKHPIVLTSRDALLTRDFLHVGIVGDMRPEKGFGTVMPCLQREVARRPMWRLRVGSNRPNFARETWPSIDVTDTTTQSSYQEFLGTLDVLIAPYPSDNYKYRVSGIIAEAIGAGCAIICTDTPAFRAQILSPEISGFCIAEGENFSIEAGHALDRIAEDLSSYRSAAHSNAMSRTAEAVFKDISDSLDIIKN